VIWVVIVDPNRYVPVTLIVTNFAGGKQHYSNFPRIGAHGLRDVARLAQREVTDGGIALAIQEMTTTEFGLPTRSAVLEASFVFTARSSFVPRVSTAWYPLVEKWNRDRQPSSAKNEGLCVVTGRKGLTLLPWHIGEEHGSEASFSRAIDLPTFEFPHALCQVEAESDWIRATPHSQRVPANEVYFRPTYYQGSRDSDPRVAQACLLGWFNVCDPDDIVPAYVLINVHLSTLRREYAANERGRTPSLEATFLREAQLMVIARYVHEVELSHELPVIVAGDFNAEPDSPEMSHFAEKSGLVPLLAADVCWKCGVRQIGRPAVAFYEVEPNGFSLTMDPQPGKVPAFWTDAVCCNEDCLEPRFTHKRNLQLLDNIFVSRTDSTHRQIITGIPRVDLSWGYSDHASIIVPLRVVRNGL